jgi:hypothetical protein
MIFRTARMIGAVEEVQARRLRTLMMRKMHQIMKDFVVSPTNRTASFSAPTTRVIHA